VNYTRWGIVYLADMLALEETAPTVYNEFMAGNFVVKDASTRYQMIWR